MPTYNINQNWQETGNPNNAPEMGYKHDMPDMNGAFNEGDVEGRLEEVVDTIVPETPDQRRTRIGVIINSL